MGISQLYGVYRYSSILVMGILLFFSKVVSPGFFYIGICSFKLVVYLYMSQAFSLTHYYTSYFSPWVCVSGKIQVYSLITQS